MQLINQEPFSWIPLHRSSLYHLMSKHIAAATFGGRLPAELTQALRSVMSPTWSAFQSLIQLSIALNAAFAAFGTYAGSSISREEAVLRSMYEEINDGRMKLPPRAHEDLGGKHEVTIILGRCRVIWQEYNNFVQGSFRSICILFSAIAIPVLIYSSYYPECPISYHMDLLMIGLFYPFYWGIWRVVWFSKRVFTEVRRKRIYIQGRMENV